MRSAVRFGRRVVLGAIAAAATLAATAAGVASGAGPEAAAAHAVDVPGHSSLVIIVNTQNPVHELSIGELRRILLGETTRWPDGRRITIAMRDAGEPERDALLRLVCSMTDQDFTRYLLQSTFRGSLQASPKILDSPNGVRRFIFNVPGAIGYVRGDEVDASVKALGITGMPVVSQAFGLTLAIK